MAPLHPVRSASALGAPVLIMLAVLAGAIGPAASPGPLRAAVSFQVNSTADAIDAAPGDGLCQTATAGECTLRAAIMEANHTPGGGATVNVPAGAYVLSIPAGAGDDETHGDLDITASMALVGAGRDNTFIDGGASDAIGSVLKIAPAISVTISSLTVQRGRAIGGIANYGALELQYVAVTENMTSGIYNFKGTVWVADSLIHGNGPSVHGGGITNWGGSVTVSNTVVNKNKGNFGGGIFIIEVEDGSGLLVLNDSVVRDNEAVDGGGLYGAPGHIYAVNSTISGNSSSSWGGGIFNYIQANLINSTISRNRGGWGGGVFNYHQSVLTLTNSTVSSNYAAYDGGGIYNADAGIVRLSSVTIAGNYSDHDLNGTGSGGGVYNAPSQTLVGFQNTIVGANFESAPDGESWQHAIGDCWGALNSGGYNLMQAYSAACAITGAPVTLADPRLGPLAFNGGPTQTHALLADSPARDAGDPDGCRDSEGAPLSTDQRGLFRHAGGRCDIGAFEYHAHTYYLPVTAR